MMPPRYRLSMQDRRAAFRIVAIYVVVASLWIYASDSLLGVVMQVPAGIVTYSVLKGLAFIVVTACLFYYFVARYIRQRQIEESLEGANRELERQVKERTKDLEESEERYRALVLASSDVVFRMSPDWREMREVVDRNVLSHNGEPITDWLQKYIHPDDQPHVMEVITDSIRAESTYEIEHRILRADGTIGWTFSRAVPLYDHDGKLVEWVGHASDVTRRKEAEDAVKKSERKFSTFFHAASDLMTITTLKEGRVLDINEAALQALGYEREEIIGEVLHQSRVWESPGDRKRAVRLLEDRGTIRNIEVRIKRKDGRVLFGLLSAELMVIDEEKCIFAIIRDVTERKRAEEEVERLNTDLAARAFELELANEDLEAFNYSVAHDLRKPLTVVNAYCQAIQELYGDDLAKDCKDLVQQAYEGTLRMDRLIEALLDFSRMARVELHREVVDLTKLAQEEAEEMKAAEPERRVILNIADGIMADGDANLLRVALNNLIGNAWKYTGAREEAIVEFGTTEIDGQKAYFVRDNGAGFAMADAEKLFTPFQRLPGAEEFKGFGIGLATVERIIRRHGGRIWAEGGKDKGATFYFTLPHHLPAHETFR